MDWEWLINKDFANYWIAARLVLDGSVQDLFADHATYFRHMQAAFGQDYPWHNWSYPPHYLLLIWPLGLISYLPAMGLFLASTLCLYLLALHAFLRACAPAASVSRLAAIAVLPFLLSNLEHAQNGYLTGSLFLAGLAFRREHPWGAGLCFALLTIKPQLGLILPFLLLAERNYRCILSTLLWTTALIALSALIFGPATWQGYLTETLSYQSTVMTQGTGYFLGMMPSVFGSLRGLGTGSSTALTVHLLLAVPVFAATLFALWRGSDPGQRAILTLTATFLVTPYWLVYDFGPVAGGLALFILSRPARESSVAAVACLIPLMSVPLIAAGLPLAPLMLLLPWLYLVRRMLTTADIAD